MGRLYPPHRTDAMGKTLRWVIPGSRLLLTHRAAMLQSGLPDIAFRSLDDGATSGVSDDGAKSGSPPGVWSAQHAACLATLPWFLGDSVLVLESTPWLGIRLRPRRAPSRALRRPANSVTKPWAPVSRAPFTIKVIVSLFRLIARRSRRYRPGSTTTRSSVFP